MHGQVGPALQRLALGLVRDLDVRQRPHPGRQRPDQRRDRGQGGLVPGQQHPVGRRGGLGEGDRRGVQRRGADHAEPVPRRGPQRPGGGRAGVAVQHEVDLDQPGAGAPAAQRETAHQGALGLGDRQVGPVPTHRVVLVRGQHRLGLPGAREAELELLVGRGADGLGQFLGREGDPGGARRDPADLDDLDEGDGQCHRETPSIGNLTA